VANAGSSETTRQTFTYAGNTRTPVNTIRKAMNTRHGHHHILREDAGNDGENTEAPKMPVHPHTASLLNMLVHLRPLQPTKSISNGDAPAPWAPSR